MPPTERCPFRLASPRSAAPFRKAASSASSASVNGTFIHERSALATGLRKKLLASSVSYSSRAFSSLRRAISVRPPSFFSHWNTSPAR